LADSPFGWAHIVILAIDAAGHSVDTVGPLVPVGSAVSDKSAFAFNAGTSTIRFRRFCTFGVAFSFRHSKRLTKNQPDIERGDLWLLCRWPRCRSGGCLVFLSATSIEALAAFALAGVVR
jgi:hypothetical protein